MYYNVEFFFEKPYRLYTSEEESEHSVPYDIYEKYLSGDYIKGENGEPILNRGVALYREVEGFDVIEPVEEEFTDEVSNEHIMSAISELSEMVATLIGEDDE